MVDSHCHIAGPEFLEDLTEVVRRADASGITRALVVLDADDADELARAPHVVRAWPSVRYAVGLHPHVSGRFEGRVAEAVDQVRTAIEAQGDVRALGEIGLDYHYDYSPRPVQQEIFRAQIRLSRALSLPLVIHTREADDDTFAILDQEEAGHVGGVFHCFSGDRAMARQVLDRGFYISLSGIVTFPKALEVKEVARMVPLDRLLVETDSPFLAPVPHRGRRNEPAWAAVVGDAVAEIRGVARTSVAEATRANFDRLFGP